MSHTDKNPSDVSGVPAAPSGQESTARTPAKPLEKAITDVQLLIEYVARNALKPSVETLLILAESKRIFGTKEWNSEKEAEFWNAYSDLSRFVYPVSIRSLKSVKDEFGKPTLWGRLAGNALPVSRARHATFIFRVIGLAVLTLVLLAQVSWLVGTTIVNDHIELRQKTEAIQEQTRTQEIEMELARLSADSARARRVSKDLDRLAAQQDYIREKLTGNFRLLSNWLSVVEILFPPSTLVFRDFRDVLSNQSPEKQELLVNLSAFALQVTLLYFLPLLYGLLGACAYVLRQLSIEIRNYTYVVDMNVGLSLRLQLGALAGLVIGWFISPKASFDDIELISVYNLSPLAISFLAGYSIELLFSAMDKFIHNYTGTNKEKNTREAG